MMARLFISHSSTQTETANRLIELLRPFGHVVVNPDFFGSGEAVVEPIVSAIQDADVVVAIFDQSASSIFDLGIAVGLGKPLLVVVSSNSVLPNELSSVNSVRVDELDESAAYRILSAIAHLEARIQRQVHPKSSFGSIAWGELRPSAFEKRIGEWFAAAGTELRRPKTPDSGFDFLVSDKKSRIKYVVETKKLTQSDLISIDPIRHLLDAIIRFHANGGILITTADFTNSAREFAKRSTRPLLLWRTSDIDNWQLPLPRGG